VSKVRRELWTILKKGKHIIFAPVFIIFIRENVGNVEVFNLLYCFDNLIILGTFCRVCASQKVVLNSTAIPVRVCNECYIASISV
jgi:hypothetical protein